MPSGAIAIACGLSPTFAMTAPAVPAATSTGVTESSVAFATYAVLPSGVIATADGPAPTAIAVPRALLAVSIGVTALPLTT